MRAMMFALAACLPLTLAENGQAGGEVERGSVRAQAQATDVAALASLAVPEPTAAAPVALKAALLAPTGAQAGGKVTLAIKGRLMQGWHVYALDPTQTFTVTEFRLTLPPQLTPAGDWTRPRALPYEADPQILIYRDEFLFTRELRLTAGTPPGAYEVTVEMIYQACDPYICLPPAREKQVLRLTVQ